VTMRTWLLALIVVGQLSPVAFADDFQSRVDQHRREFEQRRAEMQRQFEQRRDEMRKQFEQRSSYGNGGAVSGSGTHGVQTYGTAGVVRTTTSATNSRSTTGAASSTTSAVSMPRSSPPSFQQRMTAPPVSDRMKGTEFDPLPFDAKKAPSPDLCFLKFVATARTARSMDELLAFVPFAQQRVLKERQQQWNPQQAAANKADWKRRDPSMSEQSLEHLTGAPYTGELKNLSGIASKVMRVMEVKITGPNKAELKVATQSTLSTNAYGKREDFPYSTANVEMLGEGDYWRMKTYNDNNVHYKEPQ